MEGLPIYTFRADDGIKELFCPTEVGITDRREKELTDLGFIALVHCKGSDKAAFFGGQTTNKPKKYISADANANAGLSARLPYILAISRFAHYLKAMMREKLGSTMSRSQADQDLNEWVANYVIADENASPAANSERPLREARIEVMEVPGKPGALRAVHHWARQAGDLGDLPARRRGRGLGGQVPAGNEGSGVVRGSASLVAFAAKGIPGRGGIATSAHSTSSTARQCGGKYSVMIRGRAVFVHHPPA